MGQKYGFYPDIKDTYEKADQGRTECFLAEMDQCAEASGPAWLLAQVHSTEAYASLGSKHSINIDQLRAVALQLRVQFIEECLGFGG